MKKLKITNSTKKYFDYPIVETTYLQDEEVFDITVDNETHTYWTGGLNVSNCAEIGFKPVDKLGNSGFHFCNLITINGKTIKDEDDFLRKM